jgi:hypothetical protein
VCGWQGAHVGVRLTGYLHMPSVYVLTRTDPPVVHDGHQSSVNCLAVSDPQRINAIVSGAETGEDPAMVQVRVPMVLTGDASGGVRIEAWL